MPTIEAMNQLLIQVLTKIINSDTNRASAVVKTQMQRLVIHLCRNEADAAWVKGMLAAFHKDGIVNIDLFEKGYTRVKK